LSPRLVRLGVNHPDIATSLMEDSSNAQCAVGSTDAPPSLMQMFINSTDALRHRGINQKIPPTWNDRPPLFEINVPSKRRPYLWGKPAEDHVTEQEDPNLLKGVSLMSVEDDIVTDVQSKWLSDDAFGFFFFHHFPYSDDPQGHSTALTMRGLDVQRRANISSRSTACCQS
jgi:hypothetical protein